MSEQRKLAEDADERRMWDDSKKSLGLTGLQRVGMMLHAASQMAPQGGSYRDVMAIAYNEVMQAEAQLASARKALIYLSTIQCGSGIAARIIRDKVHEVAEAALSDDLHAGETK